MLEKHRLTYLEHLGIDQYVPTCVLPHAAPSQLLSDEALLEPTAFSTADMPALPASVMPSPVNRLEAVLENEGGEGGVETVSAESVVEIDQVLNSDANSHSSGKDTTQVAHVIESETVQNAAKETVKETTVTSEADQPIRFTLNVWRIRDNVMVIDSRQPGAALPTEKLLQNMLRSVGLPLAQLPPSELLRWPLFKDERHNPQEEEEARAMVQAFISAQLALAPVPYLLLLGKDAIRFALTMGASVDEFYSEHQGNALLQSQWQAQALIAPSLVDMLLEPLQKRIAWQALQHMLPNQ